MSKDGQSDDNASKLREAVRPAVSLSHTLGYLQHESKQKVRNALVLIRTRFIKEKDGPTRLRRYGGLQRLLRILRECDDKEMLDLTLSILGNCCMEDKTRVEVLKDSKEGSVRNRVCRTLGNLCLDSGCADDIHEAEGILPSIVGLLKNTDDPDCQQTYMRTLRLLANTTAHTNAVLEVDALRTAAELLKSEQEAVQAAAMKMIMDITQECSTECVRQLVAADSISSLVKLTSHCSQSISHVAWSMLLTLSKNDQIRPTVGGSGAIQCFIAHIKSTKTPRQNYSVINVLCMCSQDVNNRRHIRQNDGLELLLQLTNNEEYVLIHDRIISAFLCFLYDDASLEILLSNQFVETLMKQLHRCTRFSELSDIPEEDDMEVQDFNPMFKQPRKRRRKESTDESLSNMVDDQPRDSDTEDRPKFLRCDSLKEPNEGTDQSHKFATFKDQNIDNPGLGERSKANISETMAVTYTEMLSIPSRDNKARSVDAQVEVNAHVKTTKSEGATAIISSGHHNLESNNADRLPLTVTPVDTCLKETSSVLESATQKPSDKELNISQHTSSQKRHNILPVGGASSAPNISLGSDADPSKNGNTDDTDMLQAKNINVEECRPKAAKPKFSIDSPTYQSVVEWKLEDYASRCKSRSFGGTPHCARSPASSSYNMSPPHTSPYRPLSPPSSYVSPEFSPETSPAYSASSPSTWFTDVRHPWSDTTSLCGDWSPIHPGSCISSPGIPVSPDSPDTPGSIWWCPKEAEQEAQYSSEEEDEQHGMETDLATDAANINPSCMSTADFKRVGSSEAWKSPLTLDPVFTDAMQMSDFGRALEGENLSLAQSNNLKRSKRRSGSSEQKQKSLNLELKSKILQTVQANRSSEGDSVDISDLLLKSEPSTPLSELSYGTSVSSLEPTKASEHNILVLLSRISQMNDPSDHLLTKSCLGGLLNYVCTAESPLPRSSRILLRLIRNPLCLEHAIFTMLPLSIHSKLGRHTEKTKCIPAETETSVILVKKKLFRSEENKEGRESVFDETNDKYQEIPGDASQLLNSKYTSHQSAEVGHQDSAVDAHGQPVVVSGNEDDEVKVSISPMNDTRNLRDTLLNNLAIVAESSYGKGVVAHILLTGTPEERIKCACALPLICRTGSYLRDVLVKNGGLDILLENCKPATKDVNLNVSYVIESLHLLGNRLKMDKMLQEACPKISEKNEKPERAQTKTTDNGQKVHFILDDGHVVSADRTVMVAESQVFAAMLDGHYAESDQSEITMPQTSSKSFQFLVDFMHNARSTDYLYHVTWSSGDESSSSSCHWSLDDFLAILALADQYMLLSLKDEMSAFLCHQCIKERTLMQIFRFSTLHNCPELANACLMALLSLPMRKATRAMCLTDLSSPDIEAIGTKMLKNVIVTALRHLN